MNIFSLLYYIYHQSLFIYLLLCYYMTNLVYNISQSPADKAGGEYLFGVNLLKF